MKHSLYLWASHRYSYTPFCNCCHSSAFHTTLHSPHQHGHLVLLDTSYCRRSGYRVCHHSTQTDFHFVDHSVQSRNAYSTPLTIYYKQSSFLICLPHWPGLHHNQGILCEHSPSWDHAMTKIGPRTCNRSCRTHPSQLDNLSLGYKLGKKNTKKKYLVQLKKEMHVENSSNSEVMLYVKDLISSRHSFLFYWKSLKLIGLPAVYYTGSLIEPDCTCTYIVSILDCDLLDNVNLLTFAHILRDPGTV